MMRSLTTLLLFLGLGFGPLLAQGQGGGNAPPPAVVVETVSNRDVSPSTQHVGRVEAINTVQVRARVEGILEKRAFAEGRQVSAGDELFLIERATFEIAADKRKAELAAAEATLKNAQAKLKRTQVLRNRNALAQAELDTADADAATALAGVDQAKAALREAELNLGYTRIVSPIDGVVSRASTSVGNLVGPSSDPLATVTSVDPIYVTIRVSEKNLLRVRRQGLNLDAPKVEPTLILSDGEPYDHIGKFDYLDPSVQQSTDTVLARATFPNPKSLLIPGEFVRVTVRLKEKLEALAVSQSAVQEDSKGHFVLVVNREDTVEVRRVQMGDRADNYWVVRDGLSSGERVIVQGLQKVKAGAKVTVSPAQ